MCVRLAARSPLWWAAGAAAAFAWGCSTYTSALGRGRRAYEAGEEERALVVLRALERDIDQLSPAELTRYAYLRGMTDYRLGYRAEARHWLALAAACETQTPGSLPSDWSPTLAESLNDLSSTVYASGVAALSDVPVPGSHREATVVEAADDSSGFFDGGAPPAPASSAGSP